MDGWMDVYYIILLYYIVIILLYYGDVRRSVCVRLRSLNAAQHVEDVDDDLARPQTWSPLLADTETVTTRPARPHRPVMVTGTTRTEHDHFHPGHARVTPSTAVCRGDPLDPPFL